MAVTTNFSTAVVDLVESFGQADKLTFRDAIVNDITVDNEIEKEREVLYGVNNGDLVPIIEKNDSYTMFPVADETVCGTNECDLNVNVSATKWELALIKCKVPICMNSFDREFLRFFNQNRDFTNDPDLDTLLLQYLGERFKQGLENAKWRRAYFADQASTSPLLDGANGFFVQAQAGTVVGETQIDIADTAMTGEQVYDLLGQMYDLASAHTWFNPLSFQYEVSWKMAVAYSNWLNKLGHNAPANCQCIVADGVVKANVYTLYNLYYNGIPVKPRRAFDGVISQIPSVGSPNRALLAKNENLLVGSSDADQLNFFDIWYNKDDEKIYMRGGSYIGASIPKVNEVILAI